MKLGHGNQAFDIGSSGQVTVDASPLKTMTTTATKIKPRCVVHCGLDASLSFLQKAFFLKDLY